MPFLQPPSVCPICKEGKDFIFILDFSKDTNQYSLYGCLLCKVEFWQPIKATRNDWYEGNNYYRIRDLGETKVSRGYHKKFLEMHKFFPENTKVLDLGCGSGEFIAKLKKMGCDVWGVDFDRTGIDLAKKVFGLENVYAMSFEEFFKKQNLPKFDIITLFEIIEHLEDPLPFLVSAEKLFTPEGKIVLSTPYQGRMLPNLNAWDFPPHHFTRWNPSSLSTILSKVGFKMYRICFVEEFKILAESAAGKFQTGLVGKSLKTAYTKKSSLIIPKIIYFLGMVKSFVLGVLPATFLFAVSRITGRNNGIMLAEFKRENKRNTAGKKVFFLLPNFYQAGGHRVVSELSFNLSEGLRQTLVLFENKVSFPFNGKIISLDVALSVNFLQRFYRFFIRLYRFKEIISKEKPDWVVSFGDSANIINILTNKNSIARVDMFLSKEYSGFLGILFKVLINTFFNKSSKIITVSRASARDLVDNFGVKKEKISTIYNPIDVEKIKILSQEGLEPQYEEIFKNPTLVSVGRLARQKGQWHLIRAFSQIKKEIKNLKLVILGDGELEAHYKELIKDYQLEGDIFLLPWHKNPFKFIAKSQLFILSSLWEGLPMVAIEAMACGVPVICSDARSGAREILAPDTDFNFETNTIEYAKYGVLTPVCDGKLYTATNPLTKEETMLGEAIAKVLTDEVLKNNLITGSSERAQYFDIKNIIKEWDFLTN